eukprot:gene8446-8536_t
MDVAIGLQDQGYGGERIAQARPQSAHPGGDVKQYRSLRHAIGTPSWGQTLA